MRVLPAVLANARHVALDVAGIRVGVSNGGVSSRIRASVLAHELLIQRAMARCARPGSAAPDDAPGLRDGIDLAFVVLRRSRAACRRRNRRGDTIRRPSRRARARPSSASTCSRQVSARWCSPRASAIGANSHRSCAGTSRARRFRPCRPAPTRFMPSFQSPVPISGRPWRRRRGCGRARARNARTDSPSGSETRGWK